MIGEAELARVLMEQAELDETARSVGWPTMEEDVLNTMTVKENLEAILDTFPLPTSEFAHVWDEL